MKVKAEALKIKCNQVLCCQTESKKKKKESKLNKQNVKCHRD